MNRWAVAAVISLLFGILGNISMYGFAIIMAGKKREWMDLGLPLSAAQVQALEVAGFWGMYWYVLWPVVFLVAVVVTSAVIALTGLCSRNAGRNTHP
jgi:hypothetical protein